jgi:hypothetical protein
VLCRPRINGYTRRMRHWLFHPLIFYPLAIVVALLLVAASLQPQKWPRAPAAVSAEIADGALIYAGGGFNSPDPSPEQHMTVVRDVWGRPQALRIAVKPNQPPPTPAERGVRILMTAEDIARIDDRPVTVEVSYTPSPVNAATGLAVSLQGIAPAEWVAQDIPPQPNTVRFELPAQFAVNAIGLRALSANHDQAYGIEITRIRVIPSG